MKKITSIIFATFLFCSDAVASPTIQINQNEFVQLKQEFFIHKKSHKRLKKIVYFSLIALSILGTGMVIKKLKNKQREGK